MGNEVFNDVRVLLNNDALLKDGASSAFSQYNKDQLTPVKVDSSELLGLVTDHNDLGSGRFADPRSQQSFKYDHLRKEASDYKPWSPDSEVESLRAAIEAEVTAYALNHYRHGVSATFSKPTERWGAPWAFGLDLGSFRRFSFFQDICFLCSAG